MSIRSLNTNLKNSKIFYIDQLGQFDLRVSIGSLTIIITFIGIYPHYCNSYGEIVANQLVDHSEETVITSVDNSTQTIHIYNNLSQPDNIRTQCWVLTVQF